jgi:DNA-binding NtrC family response regulator
MSTKPVILVVVSDVREAPSLAQMLRSDQYQIVAVESPDGALACLEDPVDLVIIDHVASDVRSLELLRVWKRRWPGTPFVFVAYSPDFTSAVEAMKLGAADYVAWPVDASRLSLDVARWLEAGREDESLRHLDSRDANTGEVAFASGASISIPPGTSLEALERAAVKQALEQHRGNRTHAAKDLGISVRTLQRKLKVWGNPRSSSGNWHSLQNLAAQTPLYRRAAPNPPMRLPDAARFREPATVGVHSEAGSAFRKAGRTWA